MFQICNTLNSVGMDRGATISYQTLSPAALKNIGRENLTLDHFSELLHKYNEAGVATYSELILGFPGETYESFCRGICTLLEQGQHSSLFVYLCELLPNAVMKSDSSWKFKGWYTKTKGRGDHVKAMREKDSGNKSLYPLFQKTLRYDANGDKGEIVVIYTDRADTTIARALRGVTPKDYTKNGKIYTFDKWVLEDDVYTATFKNQKVRFNVVLDTRSFNIEEAQVGDRITVFDMDGRIVKRGIVSNGSQHVEVPKPGSYTVRVGKDAVQVNVK